MPAILDGYHWRKQSQGSTLPGAGGFFLLNGQRITLAGTPKVLESDKILTVEMSVKGGQTLTIRFEEKGFSLRLFPDPTADLALSFEWDPTKSTVKKVEPKRVAYQWKGFDYHARLTRGTANPTENGWKASASQGEIRLLASQE